jgi:hypothetical protein
MPLDATASQSKPFIRLGDPSTAPTLDYNLPQQACYSVEGYAVLNLPPAYYAPPTREVPADNPWFELQSLPPVQILDKLRSELITGQSSLLLGADVVKNAAAAVQILPKVEVATVAIDTGTGTGTVKYPSTETPPYVPVFDSLVATSPEVARAVAGAVADATTATTKAVVSVSRPPLASAAQADVLVAGVPLDYVAGQVAAGRLPRLYKRFSGALALEFLDRPAAPQPTLTIVEHYRVCSFLGNYGAGKVVQTFSLLPGERTQITIKSYKNQSASESTTASSSATTTSDASTGSQTNTSNSSVKNRSENLLDSYSEAAANEFEDLVNSEHGIETLDGSSSSSYGSTNTNSTSVPRTSTAGGGLKINLGFVSFGGGGSTTSGGTTSQTNTSQGMTSNAARSTAISALESAVSKHVARSSQNRDMQVNTTTGSTNTAASQSGATTTASTSSGTVITTGSASENSRATGDENLNLRELQNINLSRTLNYVFRQMQQEYVTIMYLHDISFVYSNGYPGSEQTVRLPDLERLLASVLSTEAQRQEVRESVARHVCNVYDYRGQRVPFAERYTENQFSCPDPGAPATAAPTNPSAATYLRKRRALGEKKPTGTPNAEDIYNNITVPGIILSVQSHILRTDSLLVDTVLGQGEALDFYNSSLQEQAVERARLESARVSADIGRTNAESEQIRKATSGDETQRRLAQDILARISDPQQQAEAYRHLFNDHATLDDIIRVLQELRP